MVNIAGIYAVKIVNLSRIVHVFFPLGSMGGTPCIYYIIFIFIYVFIYVSVRKFSKKNYASFRKKIFLFFIKFLFFMEKFTVLILSDDSLKNAP